MEQLSLLNPEKLAQAAHILKTLAHPLRIALVDQIRHHGTMSVTQLCEATGAEQSLVSHHLSSLKAAGVLNADRSGKKIYYSLGLPEVVKVLQCMERCQL